VLLEALDDREEQRVPRVRGEHPRVKGFEGLQRA
jgi:hypothetical protein